MNRSDLRALLEHVAAGDLAPDEAAGRLLAGPLGEGAGYADMGFARLDTHRAVRTGDPEVIYGAGKSVEQNVALLRELRRRDADRAAVATRLSSEALDAVRAEFPDALIDTVGGCAAVGPRPALRGHVCVVTAGTSDLPVAAEAAMVTSAYGANVSRLDDVGVSGLHRLLDSRALLEEADCLVVIAGMDGVLPSVVGGLVGVPLVAVPTSVGYGASYGGLAALLGMLNSCAPGVTVCNIDNGYGAGVFAARVARRAAPRDHGTAA